MTSLSLHSVLTFNVPGHCGWHSGHDSLSDDYFALGRGLRQHCPPRLEHLVNWLASCCIQNSDMQGDVGEGSRVRGEKDMWPMEMVCGLITIMRPTHMLVSPDNAPTQIHKIILFNPG